MSRSSLALPHMGEATDVWVATTPSRVHSLSATERARLRNASTKSAYVPASGTKRARLS